MARRRRSRRSYRRSYAKHSAGIGKMVQVGTGLLSFVSQITSKDAAIINAAPDLMTKGKIITNSILGRVTGFNAFSDVTQQKQTINPAGVLNKYTGMGIASYIYGRYAPKGLPAKHLARKAGAGLLLGGIIGGFFDDPKPNSPLKSNQVTSGSGNQSGSMLA